MSPLPLVAKVKSAARSLVNRAGFDVVKLRNSHADLDIHLGNVFRTHAIDAVIDVGANAGQYGAFLRKAGFDGHIISFEPVRSVFERLSAAAEGDPRWAVYNLALGEAEETKTINVYDSTVFSSFLKASSYSKQIWRSLEGVHPEEVHVRRLDALFPEFAARTKATRFFLKMDTQGYDLNVFAGATACMPSMHGLQSELSLIPVYDGMPRAYDVLDRFHGAGFQISGMYPINRDGPSLAVIEYDCVLVRREMVVHKSPESK